MDIRKINAKYVIGAVFIQKGRECIPHCRRQERGLGVPTRYGMILT